MFLQQNNNKLFALVLFVLFCLILAPSEALKADRSSTKAKEKKKTPQK